MRTTITIKDKIDRQLRKYADEHGIRYKDIINTVLEKGLERLEALEAAPPYVVEPSDFGLMSGVDPAKLNQTYDDLEAEEGTGCSSPT